MLHGSRSVRYSRRLCVEVRSLGKLGGLPGIGSTRVKGHWVGQFWKRRLSEDTYSPSRPAGLILK